jgi:hypothetical protein
VSVLMNVLLVWVCIALALFGMLGWDGLRAEGRLMDYCSPSERADLRYPSHVQYMVSTFETPFSQNPLPHNRVAF